MIAMLLAAAALTVPAGETWAFTIAHGSPTHAHKVAAGAKPAKGEIVVAVRAMMGTTMIITNASRTHYLYHADLVGTARPATPKLCKLPANGKPVFESWPIAATAVRIGDFRPTTAAGACP